jgi:hypothetical protein
VYCGELFCETHGERGEDYLEVCHRKACQAKWQDVQSHHEWIERVRGANRVAVCAQELCEERMQHQCQRCRLMFCNRHLHPQTIVDRLYDPPRRVSLLLCPHCTARRELWD